MSDSGLENTIYDIRFLKGSSTSQIRDRQSKLLTTQLSIKKHKRLSKMNLETKKKDQSRAGTGNNSQNRYFLLYELFQSISSTLDPKAALNLIIDAAMKITGATSATLGFVDWDKRILNIEVARGFVKQVGRVKLEVGKGITGWVAETGQSLLVKDVSKDPRYFQLKKEIKSEMAVPLKIDGKLIGVVNVESTASNAFALEDLELLTLLSRQSAQVIQNSQLFDALQRKVEELSSLIEINKTIARSLSLDKILNQIVVRTAKLMDSKLCSLRLLSEDSTELILKAYHGATSRYRSWPNIKVEDSLLGKVVQSKKPLQVIDVKKNLDYRLSDLAQKEGLQSLLSVPLKGRDRIIGVINIYKSTQVRFSEEEIKLVKTFADLCAIAIENARLYEKMVTLEEQTRRAEKLAVVGELSVGIAHEIRNPLTIIKMILESDAALIDKDVEIINTEMARMNKIIARFLDFAKPSEPVREECDINQNLNNVLLLLSHALEKKKIKVKSKIDKAFPRIFADPLQLQQVFLNLLLNSTEALSQRGKIILSSRCKNRKSIEIVIQDNGPGLPEEIRNNMFVPFTTTKPNGLGLGLSIVKRIVDAHNGRLHIESSAKTGTKTTIELPVLDEAKRPKYGVEA